MRSAKRKKKDGSTWDDVSRDVDSLAFGVQNLRCELDRGRMYAFLRSGQQLMVQKEKDRKRNNKYQRKVDLTDATWRGQQWSEDDYSISE